MFLKRAPSVVLRLSRIPEVVYTSRNIPLRVIFENVGRKPIRLLRLFEPMPVFFEINMQRDDGTPLYIPGAGKIDLARHQHEYIVLRSGEHFELDVQVAAWMPSHEPFITGRYTMMAIYHNQYGENCLKGVFKSNAIDIMIAE